MAKTKSEVFQIHPQSSGQDMRQSPSHSEQYVVSSEQKVVQKRIEPRYPNWPTSKRGPLSTPPLAGMHSINPFRPEQVTQIDQTDQQSVESLQYSAPDASSHGPTSLDQQKTAQDTLGKRKQRL
jgi:hypothetical protein